ncbi:MAG: hydroxymethylglutaryl-CoA lyase [Cyclobacteriaceae bacterium]
MKIIECPRDAMQGLHDFVPTELKAKYINQLLKVGFDTIDFGSFVSPKAIPQLRDTADVLSKLDLSSTESRLLAIVANTRGAADAEKFEEINYLGFPLSLSETFQQKNTNKSVDDAFNTVSEIQEICTRSGKQLVTYLSMGFGNPYGNPYEAAYLTDFVERLIKMDIRIISLADTVGMADESVITSAFETLIGNFEEVEFGAHLHANPKDALMKVDAAYRAGCRRFDGAINGYGGCPMADDVLVGNLATESIVQYAEKYSADFQYNKTAFKESMNIATEVFGVF